jgi:DNA anti-recombination protein RmuC
VCVKLDKKKAHTLDPFNVFGKGHQLYHYNDLDSKAGEKIPKRYISEESVDSALETLKEVNEKIKCFQEKWAEIKSQSSNLFKNRNEKIQFSKSTKSSSKDIRSVLKNLQNRVQTDLKFLQGSKSEEFSKIEESLENLQGLMQNSNLEYKI